MIEKERVEIMRIERVKAAAAEKMRIEQEESAQIMRQIRLQKEEAAEKLRLDQLQKEKEEQEKARQNEELKLASEKE